MAPNESPFTCMISFMFKIQMESLSLVVFEIFETKANFTRDLGSRTKVTKVTKLNPIYDFLYVYNTNGVSISRSF